VCDLPLSELTALAQARNQFYQQANENGMVQKELEVLKPGAKVYKMIGPVLLKQVQCLVCKAHVWYTTCMIMMVCWRVGCAARL
jgi:Prefoldin subunit